MKFTNNIPIFMQIAQMVEDRITSGEWKEDERIPSTREMAVDLSVNPATVIRAYEHLTDRDLIRQQRGLGYFVSLGAAQAVLAMRRKEFFEHTAPQFFKSMSSLGISLSELREWMPDHFE